MFEIQLPGLKKFQNIAGIAAGIGFVLGLLLPAVAILGLHWHCPFGDGILQIGGFIALTGLGSTIIVGNLTGLILIGIAKSRRMLSDSSKKRRQ